MNRDEMLKELHLTDLELKDLLDKFYAFRSSLNHDQRETVYRSLPRLEEALKSFGPGITEKDLQELLCIRGDGTICSYFLAQKAEKDAA